MIVMECIIVAIVALCACVFGYCNKAFRYFENRGVKHLKPVMLFGNVMTTTMRRKHVFYQMDDFYKSFPDERVIGIYEFLSPVFMIRDPYLIKQVLVKDFDHFVDHRTFFEKDHDEVFGSNLAALKGEKWRLMRSTLSPAFTGSRMRHMCPFVVKCAEQVVLFLRTECERKQNKGGSAELDVELKDLYTRFANDVIASTVFGYEVNSFQERGNSFFKTGKRMFTFEGFQMLKFYFILTFPKLCKLLRMSIFSSKGTRFFKDIFLSTVKHRQELKIVRKDMVNILMEAEKGTLKYERQTESDRADFAAVEESEVGKQQLRRQNWTINELAAQTFIFFFAGFETVSSVLCFATHELVTNQQVQEKLREEIDATFSEAGDLSYETIQNMTYLDMVISEALRLWSPAPVLDRMCTQSYRVPDKDGNKTNLTIEKGTTIYIPARALGRDPKYWENPEKFDPERFSSENKHKVNSFTYLPFGSGPRNCIGSRYALMEIKIILCYLLKSFELQRNEKTPKALMFPPNTFSMTVDGGFWLKFIPRDLKLS